VTDTTPRLLDIRIGDTTVAPEDSLRTFGNWLEACFGVDYPRELAGDLSDMLHSTAAFQSKLLDLFARALRSDKAQPDRTLFDLRVWITSDLPPIFEDVKKSVDRLLGEFE